VNPNENFVGKLKSDFLIKSNF